MNTEEIVLNVIKKNLMIDEILDINVPLMSLENADSMTQLIIINEIQESIGQVFLATHNDHHTLSEIAEATSSLGLGKVEYIDWPEDKKNIEVGHAVMSNQKIKNVLNWAPSYSLLEGLDLAKEFFEPKLKFYIK